MATKKKKVAKSPRKKKAAGSSRAKTTTASKKKTSSAARKKTAARASKKASSKKRSTAAKPSKKKAASKASSKSSAAGKKKSVVRTATTRKASGSKSKAAEAAGKKSRTSPRRAASRETRGRKTKAAAPERVAVSLKDAKAAASRLAAAAGLRPVQPIAANGETAQTTQRKLKKCPLSKREVEKYREILRQKRDEVYSDVNDMESEALGRRGSELSSLPQHLADQGSDEYEQALSLGLAASQRLFLKEIDAALERIDAGVFAVCEALGVAIEKERLEATPWTRYSLEGARRSDGYFRAP